MLACARADLWLLSFCLSSSVAEQVYNSEVQGDCMGDTADW